MNFSSTRKARGDKALGRRRVGALLSTAALTACGGAPVVGPSEQWWSGSESPTIPPAWNPRDSAVSALPGGELCVQWLQTLGIPFRRLSDVRGVETPVEVTGPITGVTYMTAGKASVVGDCRLILALDWTSRTLTRVGISAVRHSGAYVYRTTSKGRPSLHARGLAIDVHGVLVGSTWYDVERDYATGVGPVCDQLQPFVNHVYCRLTQLNLFRELITPDHNAEHHDHFHLGVAKSG